LFFNSIFPLLDSRGSTASSYQISWRSVEPFLSYGDLAVFLKMVAVGHLGFFENSIPFLTVSTVQRVNVRRVKFMAIGQIVAEN